MTIKELIAALQKLPQDSEAMIAMHDDEFGTDYNTVQTVTIDGDGDVILCNERTSKHLTT